VTSRLSPALLLLLLTGCSGVLDPKGPVGAAQKLILIDAMAIMLVIVIPTIIATLAFAWWFRASNSRAVYRPEWAFSGQLELIVWAVPAIVITFLGGIAWFGSHELDPYKPLSSTTKPIEVQVVSLDWKWLFIYPGEGIATVNQLALPVGTPVHFRLTSSGVMNSFFVPQLGSQIYTMAGMVSQLHLQADHPGTYHGLSAQFSGAGFADMRFDVRAMSADDFAKWTAESKANDAALDKAAYSELVKPSSNVKPMTYGAVEAGLFNFIVAPTMPPSTPGHTGHGAPPNPKEM
jgi:cytochrome o ubiquinol oxidase subunit 2